MKQNKESSILNPSASTFEHMGLIRSTDYELLSYNDILQKYRIKSKLLNSKTGDADKLKKYLSAELFLVPTDSPTIDQTPVHIPNKQHIGLNIGNEGLLTTFAQLFCSAPNWIVPEDGSIQPLLNKIKKLPSPSEIINSTDTQDIIGQWSAQYGLLFSKSIPDCLFINNYPWNYLPLSNCVYQSLQRELNSIPYFLGIQAFYELNQYALKLLFMTWLHSNEDKIRENMTDLTRESCEKAIVEGYQLLVSWPDDPFEKLVRDSSDDQTVQATRRLRNRQTAIRELCKNMAAWIQLEIAPELKNEADSDVSDKLPLGTDENEWFACPKYQCSSLFSCIMLEALHLLQSNSTFKVCEHCKKVFYTNVGGRTDRKYCSLNCKEKSRFARERKNRQKKKEAQS